MINFHGLKETKKEFAQKKVNQLQHIIYIWHRDLKQNRKSRHSALQAAIFDPAKDHNGAAMSGFPCLQQVSFGYDNTDNLSINAFYPTQYVIDRAYGNYLGLFHLGIFMAKELGLKFSRLNCFIARPSRGTTIPNRQGGIIVNNITEILNRELQ
jgi:thymidylate synthase